MVAYQTMSVVAGKRPRLNAKLTAKLPDTTGPQGMTLDAYTRPELRRCDRR